MPHRHAGSKLPSPKRQQAAALHIKLLRRTRSDASVTSTTLNYWLGLNKLAEERIVDDGSTEVFRPDIEVGDDPIANGWDYYDIGWDSWFEYATDSIRGKVFSFGATGAASIVNGDLYGADLNPSDTPWAATGRRHLGFWFRNESATSNQIKIYCRASSGYGTLVFVTAAGTDYIDSGNGCYVYYLGNSNRFPAMNDGNWNYIELDLGALQTQFSGVAGAITHVDGMMLAIADTASIHMDDIILSAGAMDRSYNLIPGAKISGYLGAQTGSSGARDVNTQTQCVSAFGRYYYHFSDLGTVMATSNANGDHIGIYEPDFFGNYRYVDGYRPDSMGTTGKFEDQDAGLSYFGYRWEDTERGRWVSFDPIGFSGGINLYMYVSDNPIMRVDPLGLNDKESDDDWFCDYAKNHGGSMIMPRDRFEKLYKEHMGQPVSGAFGTYLDWGCIGITGYAQASLMRTSPEGTPDTKCYRSRSEALARKCPDGQCAIVFAKQGKWRKDPGPGTGEIPNDSIRAKENGAFNYVTKIGDCYWWMNFAQQFATPNNPQLVMVGQSPPPAINIKIPMLNIDLGYPNEMWCTTCRKKAKGF